MTDPRVERSTAAVREAALAELATVGYGRLSIDGIAKRAGVARTTIYRHWPDLPSLVLDALQSLHRQPPPDEATTPRDRVRQILVHLTEAMRDPFASALQAALVDAGERDPRLAELQYRLNDRRRGALTAAVAAAHPEVDAELAATALAGAVMYRRFAAGRPFEEGDVDDLVEAVLGPAPQ